MPPSRAGCCPPSLAVDAGSGEGYGVAVLGAAFPGCRALGGIDYDAAATAHAARTYAGPHAAYLRGALAGLPLPDACADLVVSLRCSSTSGPPASTSASWPGSAGPGRRWSSPRRTG